MSDLNVETPSLAAPTFVFSDTAAAKVGELIAEDGKPNLKLRISVSGGGCSGFQYGVAFDDTAADDDFRIDKNGVTLIERAASRVKTFMASRASIGLRVTVKTSGCSGMAYSLEFADTQDKDDLRLDIQGVTVLATAARATAAAASSPSVTGSKTCPSRQSWRRSLCTTTSGRFLMAGAMRRRWTPCKRRCCVKTSLAKPAVWPARRWCTATPPCHRCKPSSKPFIFFPIRRTSCPKPN